jgi:predicted Rossmann-fold nucleotide-binding protein
MTAPGVMLADRPPLEFESVAKVDAHLREGRPLSGCVFQGIDLRRHTAVLTAGRLTGSAFLGCLLEPAAVTHALAEKALVVPRPEGIPYDPFRGTLYAVEQDLYAGYVTGQPGGYAATRDARIYAHFCASGRSHPPNILESLYRRLHDHGMSDALEEALAGHRVVAIMGGHRLARDTDEYRMVALLGRALARSGYLLVTGGGPGAMEAAHLGAWHAGRRDEDLDTAIAILSHAPLHTPVEPWLDTALEVRRRFDGGRPAPSIGVPTWHYGHEPSNVFPTAVAKYFANSEREDGLLAIATHGVIFAPGSAGTIQEIFQDAAQNHYRTCGFASPMIFLGRRYWEQTKPVYPLLQQLAVGEDYRSLLCITDSVAEAVERIRAFRPPD